MDQGHVVWLIGCVRSGECFHRLPIFFSFPVRGSLVNRWSYGRVAVFARCFACALVGVVGLMFSGGAFAVTQADALSACQAWVSSYDAVQGSDGFSGQCDGPVMNPDGSGRYNADIYYNGSYYTYDHAYLFDAAACSAGSVYTGPANLSGGNTVCYSGCQYSYDLQNHPGDGSVQVDLPQPGGGTSSIINFTLTSTGASCTSSDPAPPPPTNQICNTDTGVCVDYDGHQFSACKGSNCLPVPETGAGGCASDSSGALCGAPGGGTTPGGGQNPTVPVPAPPSPPIAPASPPDDTFGISRVTITSNGTSTQNSNFNGFSCGGPGQAACSTGAGACPSGFTSVGNQCVSSGTDAGSCPVGSVQGPNGCSVTPSCDLGGTYSAGVCSMGGTYSCPPGSTPVVGGGCVIPPSCPTGGSWDGSKCVSSTPPSCPPGQIADNDGVCQVGTCPPGTVNQGGVCGQPPPTCSAGEVMVNGVCTPECPAGQSYQNGACTQLGADTCKGGIVTGTGSSAVCTCPDGQVNINGTCAKSNAPPCAGGNVIGGQCICPSGTAYSNGACNTTNGGGGTGSGGGGTGGGGTGDGGGPQKCMAGPACFDSASGGADCNVGPSCTGDTVLCNILTQAWNGRCFIANAGKGGPQDSDIQAATTDPAFTTQDTSFNQALFDATGFGLSSNDCPKVPDVHVYNAVMHFGSPWCDAMSLLGNLIVLLAYLVGFKIYSGS